MAVAQQVDTFCACIEFESLDGSCHEIKATNVYYILVRKA
jgi:hypothetical protein